MKKLLQNRKGFTLIELIVVLVILGIILAITVPAVTGYIDDAKDARYIAESRAVFIAAEAERTVDITSGKVSNTATWPVNGESKDTIISDRSTISVRGVVFASGRYKFIILDEKGKPFKDVIVDINNNITVMDH